MDYVESHRAKIEHSGFMLSKTHGTSMRPLIWGGRHCVVISPLNGEPTIGDLLIFREDRGGYERNIVHRLVEIKDGGTVYITRGDNCLATETVTPGRIIGRVTEVHRLGGFRPWYAIPKRQFTVNDRAYRIYSRFWTATWPARRVYYIIRGYARAARRRIFSLFRK